MATTFDLEQHTRLRSFGTFTKTVDGQTATLPIDENFDSTFGKDLANGDADSYHKIVAADAFPSISLNFEDGSVTDFYGQTIALARIKRIIVVNRGTTGTELIAVTGNLMSDMGTGATFGGRGRLVYEDPDEGRLVTATTKDTITLTATVSGIPYTISVTGLKQ